MSTTLPAEIFMVLGPRKRGDGAGRPCRESAAADVHVATDIGDDQGAVADNGSTEVIDRGVAQGQRV